ncbi:MAG: hypothetical protein IJ877_04825 [Candidatus Gastranaerophilales bacterium]|nr:hypothetical protein [Candidatus Gastranaerophilales bacterium]
MASNVFTKKEILQNLASRGYFIDIYTLDAFFAKRKIEAIFEDSQGNEFYDKNALNIVLEGLFNANNQAAQQYHNIQQPHVPEPSMPAFQAFQQAYNFPNPQMPQPSIMPNMPNYQVYQQPYNFQPNQMMPQPSIMPMPNYQMPQQAMSQNIPNQQMQRMPSMQMPASIPPVNQSSNIQINKIENTELKIDDSETLDILNNISLSDGTPLIDKVQNVEVPNNIQFEKQTPNVGISQPQNQPVQKTMQNNMPQDDIFTKIQQNEAEALAQEKPADEAFKQDDIFEPNKDDILSPDLSAEFDDSSGFDDISLLSESLEAQEKFRQYVVDELSKKNLDVTPKANEFKLDISERTLTMIARTMAKKIAKYVGSIMAQDAKQSSKVAEYQEENRRLTQKARELEEQNRKLRLLLAESNKNLNSYKPSIFGLYKKVDPKTNKK